VDGADLRSNADAASYAVFVTGVARGQVMAKQAFFDMIVALRGGPPDERTAIVVDSIFAQTVDPSLALESLGLAPNQVTTALETFAQRRALTPEAEATIAAERTRLQNKNWNATVVEIAYAALAQAADSTGAGMSVDRHALWLTWGLPVSGWGQLLIGGQVGVARDTLTMDFDGSGSLGARLYLGGNYLKFFAELEGDFRTGRTGEILFNSGGEIRPGIGGWITFSAGLKRSETDRYDLVSSLHWSFPFERLGGL
jgi:hypothetical protein